MNLEERIARLVDPELWDEAKYCQANGLPESAKEIVKDARAVARRVIDGLGLTEQTRTMCDGLMPNGRDTYGDTIDHRLVTPWEPGDDAPEPTPRVRQIYEEDM